MGTAGVVPINPSRQVVASFGEGAEVVLPSAFLLQTSKEALDEAILLRRVRRDEFLS
jgi:hypothetical protein